MNFAAVILAGGRSSRMGRDKAGLVLAGETLLARQIKLAREVGAKQVFVSGPADRDYASLGCPVLADNFPNAGPLGGIESALGKISEPLLLALAVDMPGLRQSLLESLLAHCTEERGVVPRVAGRLEPLAGFYSRGSAALATGLLAAAKSFAPGPRYFVARCLQDKRIKILDLPDEAAADFASWNSPTDVSKAGRPG